MPARKLKLFMALGILLMAAFVGLQLNLSDSLVYFYVPEEVSAKKAELEGRTLRIGAMVKEGTVDWQPQQIRLAFTITDFNGNEFPVVYKDVKPDMFAENQGVVVEGKFADTGQFEADKLIVKHSEEYKKPDGTHSYDKELLQKSIFK